MDRLPSRANLLNRGVEISCARCVLCDMENEVETVEHFASIENKWVAKCFHGVCYVALWAIWHWRNRILHASADDVDSVRQEDIFPSIQRLSLLWISNRCPRTNCQWCEWVLNPRGAEVDDSTIIPAEDESKHTLIDEIDNNGYIADEEDEMEPPNVFNQSMRYSILGKTFENLDVAYDFYNGYGCEAIMQVTLSDLGEWVVDKFISEHNHPLDPP
ncbi:RNA-directed DNA polymerase, eukaryota, reverse transcriptase zinc-binding domain protein, partial [Tanacetum coccineum]